MAQHAGRNSACRVTDLVSKKTADLRSSDGSHRSSQSALSPSRVRAGPRHVVAWTGAEIRPTHDEVRAAGAGGLRRTEE